MEDDKSANMVADAYSPANAYPPVAPTNYPPAQKSYQPPAEQTSYIPPPYIAPSDGPYPPAGGAAYYSHQLQGGAGLPSQPNNVVVVTSQPSTPNVTYRRQQSADGQGAVIFAAVVTILFAVCFCWWALFCAIPALILASNANSSTLDARMAQKKRNSSVALSAIAVCAGVAGVAIIFFFGILFGAVIPSIHYVSKTSSNWPWTS